MYFDSHTHLNQEDLYTNRQTHLKNFVKADGIGLINIWANHEYNTRGIQICKSLHHNDSSPTIGQTDKAGKYPKLSYEKIILKKRNKNLPQVYCTIWLHPEEVVNSNITDTNLHLKLNEMCSLYTPYKEFIVGIGECGIDIYQEGSETTLSIQKDLLIQQCDLARQWNLPIVIHSRSNREMTHDILKDFTDLTIYFHCRSYTPTEIKIIKKTYPNFYIGFCGNISYPKAINIRTSLRYLIYGNENYPEYIISGDIRTSNWNKQFTINTNDKTKKLPTTKLSHILIETDAPYLPLQDYRGKQNTPALIKETYKYISKLLWIDITWQVVNNVKKCYNI